MDGNRRFARSHQIETVEGHNLGFEALAKILEVCYKSGVEVVTIYAFSVENFKRSKYEVDALMDMAHVKLKQLTQHGDLLDRYGACIRILGERDMVKPDLLDAINKAVELTSHNKKAVLNVCFPYTSRDELTTAIRNTVADFSNPVPETQRSFSASNITQKIQSRRNSSSPQRGNSPSASNSDPELEDSASSTTTLHPDTPPSQDLRETSAAVYPDPESITSKTIDEHLYTFGDPPLDLLVRTSGVERLSDFMLWQCHEKTDIVFLQRLWPEFDLWSFLPVMVEWQWRRKKLEQKNRQSVEGIAAR
ncbi:MAG: hypothetical protein M4579_000989 [Chaenotheca gracillima]|nr:MAG: hypothetical protein M4579_000989 [Chaenotheca gracillima]